MLWLILSLLWVCPVWDDSPDIFLRNRGGTQKQTPNETMDEETIVALEKILHDGKEISMEDKKEVDDLHEFTKFLDSHITQGTRTFDLTNLSQINESWLETFEKATPFLERHLEFTKKLYDISGDFVKLDVFMKYKKFKASNSGKIMDVHLWNCRCFSMAGMLERIHWWLKQKLGTTMNEHSIELLNEVKKYKPFFL